MIQVENLYCCSLKTASITFAWIITGIEVYYLIFAILYKTEVLTKYSYIMSWIGFDDDNLWKFLDSDWGFYSVLAVTIVLSLAALSCIYGVVKVKPQFMIPILVLLPMGPVMELIFLVNWFNWLYCIILIINILLSSYVWVCFFTYWQRLRKSQVGLGLDSNIITRV